MYELGVHLLFIRFPDAVHWQEKWNVRKTAHHARAFDARNRNGEENDHETLVTQDSVVRDERGCDDATMLHAALQSAGSESRARHSIDRRRRTLGGETDLI